MSAVVRQPDNSHRCSWVGDCRHYAGYQQARRKLGGSFPICDPERSRLASATSAHPNDQRHLGIDRPSGCHIVISYIINDESFNIIYVIL